MVDQLVFGYDDGHRLLDGSTELKPKTLATLLGATDAAPGGDGDARLVTAMPLKSENRYALCFTWKAPEISRPGAVWAHVLLVSMEVIAKSPEPFSISALAKRPSPSSLETYQCRLEQPVPAVAPAGQLDGQLLEDVLAATFMPSNESVVVEQDLSHAERALAVAWRLQWPALRVEFSFRTRDSVRDSKRAHVTIARRLKGPLRHRPVLERPLWVSELSRELQAPSSEAPLSRFLLEFGAFDHPEPGSVARLGTVYTAIRTGTPDEIRDAVASAYPTRDAGQQLKRVLFGGDIQDEERMRSMLVALLGSGTDDWDAFQLHLPEQIAAFISATGIESFAAALTPSPGAGIREAARLALAQRHEPLDLAVLSGSHLDLVLEVVHDAPDLLTHEEAWQGVSTEAAVRLLAAVDPPSESTIVAAIAAGHDEVVTSVVPLPEALSAIASSGDFLTAKRFVKRVQWATVLDAANSGPRISLLAAAIAGKHRLPQDLVSALEFSRPEPDEVWLRAAVAAIVSPKLPPRRVLPVVFGPLHEAMTSDRLPHDCWVALDPLLPPSADPAQRLRRYLVSEARREQWSEDEFRRAIADSGPFASQLRHDFTDDGDEWYVAVAKSVLRAVGILGR